MSKISDALKAAEQKHEIKEVEWALARGDFETVHQMEVKAAAGWAGSCKRTNPRDYADWLASFIISGGEITHVYDYKMPCDSWLIAQVAFTVTPLHGSSSKQIIVPSGIKVEIGAAGHNNIYWFDGPHASGGWVPLYTDISAILEKEG